MTATLPIRPHIELLPAYIPGRRPDQAGFGDGARLASNESPYGPLPSVLQVTTKALQEVNRYPDMASNELIAAISNFVQEQPERIAVGNGSSALIRDLVATLAGPGDEVVFATPSFPYYLNATIGVGATPVPVPLDDHRHDLQAMAAAVTPNTRVVFVCNPNNPTGTLVDSAELAAFVAQVPDNVAVVVDEAYIEFCAPGAESLGLARRHPNVVILRTFSKAYGLAGLRVGYLIGPAELAEHVRRIGVPFGVNLLAQSGATVSLSNSAQAELADRTQELVGERTRLQNGLAEAGLPVVPSEANFVFLPLREESAAWVSRLESEGIMVRGLGGGIRITVGTARENDRVIRVARDWAAQTTE